jgi:hypothetical protein
MRVSVYMCVCECVCVCVSGERSAAPHNTMETLNRLLVHCSYTMVTLLLHCNHTFVALLLHIGYTVVTLNRRQQGAWWQRCGVGSQEAGQQRF